MMAKTVDIRKAQTQWSELLSWVTAGTEVILTEDSTPIARLVPVIAADTPRVAGLHPGAIWASDDFDEPIQDEFWTGNA